MDKVLNNEDTGKTRCRYLCMKHCSKAFCLLDSLIHAQQGDAENTVVFTGSEVYKFKDILPTKTIIQNLVKEAESVE
jgi:hypothetical protein